MKPAEYIGYDSIHRLSEVLDALSAKDVFLMTGASSFRSSGAEAALRTMLRNRTVTHFDDLTQNPDMKEIRAGIDYFRGLNCDVVIAVGGGSILDAAKLINTFLAQEESPGEIVAGRASITRRGKPLVAVPTTAGSGAEATTFAVIYVDKVKYSVEHEFVLPDVAIVDPALCSSMPARLTAETGFDALCQAIESFWAVGATDESLRYSEEAIKLLLGNLERAVLAPDRESRGAMSLGAHLAGKAINLAKTTAPHAVSYALTSFHGVAHGHAVALTLGRFLVLNSMKSLPLNGGLSSEELTARMDRLFSVMGARDAESASCSLYALMERTGLQTTLQQLGISSPTDLDRIVRSVNLERAMNNPVRITPDMLRRLLETV